MSFTFCFLLLFSVPDSNSIGLNPAFDLPETWGKDFTITINRGGGMLAGTDEATFTYDSCKYSRRSGAKPRVGSFLLSESDRIEILKKMEELHVNKIRSKTSLSTVYDKGSVSICFKANCISDNGMYEVYQEDKGQLNRAFDYLLSITENKRKK